METMMEQSTEEQKKFVPPHDEGTPHRHTFTPAIGHGSEHGVELVHGEPLNLTAEKRAALPKLAQVADPNEPNVIGESTVIDREES